jgi:ABC-type multidrug transport system ATPase subunit
MAHALFTFRVIIEVFRSYRAISTIIRILRWVLLLIFPNLNVFTLIVSILRPHYCPFDDSILETQEEFSDERYSHKILIHTLILLGQFLFYFILLILLDTYQFPLFNRGIKGKINQKEEDDDVAEERNRIAAMNEDDKQREALVVDNLSKRYGFSSIPAVNRLTFAVPHRQCFGLLGFNGSGKTTTFRMLVGDLRPTGGYISRTNKESIGYCPQDDIGFSALTVQQSIDFICRLHGLRPSSLNNLILSQFQLEKYRNRLVSHLSGGTRRRLHLALCLIGSPTLLLLDEPTAKVDPLLRNHIRLILHHRPVDTSIVFASHSMLECEQLCDRLTILVHGNARCLGSPQHLKEKYGTEYRIRLTLLRPPLNVPELERVDNSNEYTYPKSSLADLFQLLEHLVEQNIIASNYTVQLTSLEHIFLAFQHPIDMKH